MPDKFLRILGAGSDSDFWLRIALWLTALMVPLYDLMGAIILLICIDFGTGIGASWKRKRAIRASMMVNTVSKFFFYFLVILAAHATEEKVLSALPMLQIVSGFIALTELKSIFENFNTIFGLNLWEYLKQILNRKNIVNILPKDNKNGNNDVSEK